MADEKAMSEKILRTLENIINSDPDLQEFSIIPTEDNSRNISPVLYEEHCIALESWCVKHIYNYACSVLFEHKELLFKGKLTSCKMDTINTLLKGAILINPDVGTFWNMRRCMVEFDVLHEEKELYFSKIVLTHKSKSNEAFSYRRWLLKRIQSKVSVCEYRFYLKIIEKELMVADATSEKSPNNYHSWNHRIWCMENLVAKHPNAEDIIYSELRYTENWINSHISDYSGYHYRQYLLNLVLTQKKIQAVFRSHYESVLTELNVKNDIPFSNILVYYFGKKKKTLLEETTHLVNYVSMLLYDLFVIIDKLNKIYPEHETLFYHRRFIVYHLLKFTYEYYDADFQPKNKLGRNSISPSSSQNIVQSDVKNTTSENRSVWWQSCKVLSNISQSCNLYSILMDSDKEFLSRNMNSKCSAVQIELAKKHQRWLKYVVGIE